jgi:hypothetical protein
MTFVMMARQQGLSEKKIAAFLPLINSNLDLEALKEKAAEILEQQDDEDEGESIRQPEPKPKKKAKAKTSSVAAEEGDKNRLIFEDEEDNQKKPKRTSKSSKKNAAEDIAEDE